MRNDKLRILFAFVSPASFGEPSLPATDLSTVGTALPKVFSCSSSIIRGAVCALVLR